MTWSRKTTLVLSVGLSVFAAVTIYIAYRPQALATACRLGLPNFSRPSSIPADVLKCQILGNLETIDGTVLSSDHGASIVPISGAEPIALYMAQMSPDLARQTARSWSRYCVQGARARLTGWRTQTPGSYGHLGYAKQLFFVESVGDVGMLPKSVTDGLKDRDWCRAA
jgi:hypothetical protein